VGWRGWAAAAWVIRRSAAAAVIVFTVVTVTFVAIHLAPGSPFLPGPDRAVDPAVIARLRHQFGLDQPLSVQYLLYLRNLAHGDLGYAYSQGQWVKDVLAAAIPNTLLLSVTALTLDLGLGVLIGLVVAARARRATDVVLSNGSLFIYSVPAFWLGLVLIFVFADWLHWLPSGFTSTPGLYESLPFFGKVWDRLTHLILPALTLGLVGAAGTARYQRAALLETLGRDFIRTARAKGVSERRVLVVHALRNALLPLITLAGLSLPFLLTGSVLIESVFSWPGMGRVATDAVLSRDHSLVTAVAIVASTLVVTGSLVADLLYALADPRIRERAA
jgi:peptide/nickel transport system permease protein